MSKEVYFETIYSQIPRLLGLLDRNIGSPAYGCFDRQYWHYRVVDFPCARLQEAVLTLALLYNLNHNKNAYYRNANILLWINAAISFWRKIQEKNGSFNEWYPYENSFVATSFSAYAVSETVIILGKELINEYGSVLAHLKKAGDWLIPRREERAVNQTAGTAIALYNVYLLTKDDKYRKNSEDKINFLSKSQNKEGWFMEYGGADIGYLSLAVDYLAKYYQKTKNENVFKILEKAIAFFFDFIYPSKTLSGSFSSRNTEYVIPSGFEIMAKYLEKSYIIARIIRKSVNDSLMIGPASLDDRYLSYLAYNYLQAFQEAGEFDYKDDKFKSSVSEVNYPNLGIKVIKNDSFHIVWNYKKGGTFKIEFTKNNKAINDWGVVAKLDNGKMYFSGGLNHCNAEPLESNNFLKTESCLREIKKLLPGPFKFVIFRLFLSVSGRNGYLGNRLKNKLRDLMITRKNKSILPFSRTLSFTEDKLTIIDKIENIKGVETVIINAKVSYIYVPSSSYFQNSDLNGQQLIYNLKENKDSFFQVVREYDYSGNLIKASV